VSILQIHAGLYCISTPFDKTGTVFLYLLRGHRVALIDTGASDSPATVLQPALAEVGLSLGKVDLILNTHAHLDHSGGNAETKRQSGARIHVHRDDLPMASSNQAQVAFHTDPLRTLEFPPQSIQERTEHVLRNAGEPAGADVLLADGDLIDLGGIRLEVVHCPGHTPGHVAYYWRQERVLFTGDAVQGYGARPGSYPYYFHAPNYRASLERLSRLEIETLCLGHAFHGGTLINLPVRRGAEARALLQASIGVADTIHRVAADVCRQHPGGAKREWALAALDELLYEIPQLRMRQTGFPLLAAPTLLAHIEALAEGTHPGVEDR
jgi:glyoxylase-like metal-dependent hydrolase (beta-lactamase superfamily II)